MDKDLSGFLEQEELTSQFEGDESWKVHDKDADGKLSKAELLEMLKAEIAAESAEEDTETEGEEDEEGEKKEKKTKRAPKRRAPK